MEHFTTTCQQCHTFDQRMYDDIKELKVLTKAVARLIACEAIGIAQGNELQHPGLRDRRVL